MTNFFLISVPVALVIVAIGVLADRAGRRRREESFERRMARHRHPSSARRRRAEDPWAEALAEQPTTMTPVISPPTTQMFALDRPPVPAPRHRATV